MHQPLHKCRRAREKNWQTPSCLQHEQRLYSTNGIITIHILACIFHGEIIVCVRHEWILIGLYLFGLDTKWHRKMVYFPLAVASPLQIFACFSRILWKCSVWHGHKNRLQPAFLFAPEPFWCVFSLVWHKTCQWNWWHSPLCCAIQRNARSNRCKSIGNNGG